MYNPLCDKGLRRLSACEVFAARMSCASLAGVRSAALPQKPTDRMPVLRRPFLVAGNSIRRIRFNRIATNPVISPQAAAHELDFRAEIGCSFGAGRVLPSTV